MTDQTLPLDEKGIEKAFTDWYDAQLHHPSASDTFKYAYNLGCINTARYVGNQDQLCWQNGYDEAKRDADMEAGFSYDAGLEAARTGVQDVMQPEESNLDFFLGDGDNPVCRIQWFYDSGDRDVGIPSRAYWCLADDQGGTELETLLVKAGLTEKPEPTPSGEPVIVHIPPTLTADPRGFPNRVRYFSHETGNFNDDTNPVVCVAGIYESEDRTWWVNDDGSREPSYILDAAYIERHLALGNIVEHPTLEAAIAASRAALAPDIPAPQPVPENGATGLCSSAKWVDAGPVTGSMSMAGPNLQQIPKEQPWIPVPDDYMRCPVHDIDLEVEVKFRNGQIGGAEKARDWLWDFNADDHFRIVAYRVPAWEEIEANTLVSPEMDERSKRLEERVRVLRDALAECTLVLERHEIPQAAYDEVERVILDALAMPPVA